MADDLASIFKGSAVVFAGTAFQLVLGLVGKILFARYLGPLGFGGLSVGIAIATTGSAILVLGMNKGVTRHIPRFDERRKQKAVVASALHVALPVSVVASVVLVLAAPFIAETVFGSSGLTPVIRLFSLLVPVLVLYKLCNSIFQGYKRAAPKVLLENVARPVLYFALIAVVVVASGDVIDASLAYVVPWVLVTVAAVLFARFSLDAFPLSADESMHAELLVFSLPLVLSVGMQQVFDKIDVFFIGAFTSVGQVGIYSAIYPIAKMQLVALTAINFVYMPVVSELDSDASHDEVEHYYRIVTKWLFLGAFPLIAVFVLHPSWVITTVFGRAYAGGSTAFAILAVGFFLSLVMGPTANTVVSLGNTRFVMAMTTATAALNVVLNVLLIPELGISGAAIATAASYFALNGGYLAFLYARYGLFPFTSRLAVTWLALPGVIFLLGMPLSRVVDGQVGSILVVSTVAVVSSVIAYVFVLDLSEEERELGHAAARRLGLRPN